MYAASAVEIWTVAFDKLRAEEAGNVGRLAYACDLAPQTVPDAFRRPSGKASLFGAAEFVDSDDSDDSDGGGGGDAGPAPAEPADAAIPFPAMRVLDGLEAYKSLARAALLRKAVC